jgi:transposase-like protein
MVKSRRVFTREFKLAAVKELESAKPLGYVARQLEVNPNTLHRWRREFKEQPTKAFSGQRRRILAESREAELERKIGQMTMENDFSKKTVAEFRGATGPRQWRRTVYQKIRAEEKTITRLCRAAEVSRAGYYRFLKPVQAQAEEMELRDAIQKLAVQMPVYGYRRITMALRRGGWVVNHERVLRLMRADNLLCLRRRAFVRTTDSDHQLRVYPNLARDLKVSGLNQLWWPESSPLRKTW